MSPCSDVLLKDDQFVSIFNRCGDAPLLLKMVEVGAKLSQWNSKPGETAFFRRSNKNCNSGKLCWYLQAGASFSVNTGNLV